MSSRTEHLLRNYQALCDKIAHHSRAVLDRHTDVIHCRKGCDDCCRHLSLFPVEAAAIRQAVLQAPSPLRRQIEDALQQVGERCPLLVQHACLLYAARPLICRTHGLPLLVREEQGARIDTCPLNFVGIEALEGADLLNVETLNQALVAINQLYLQESGASDKRRPLAEILRQALREAESGNPPADG